MTNEQIAFELGKITGVALRRPGTHRSHHMLKDAYAQLDQVAVMLRELAAKLVPEKSGIEGAAVDSPKIAPVTNSRDKAPE